MNETRAELINFGKPQVLLTHRDLSIAHVFEGGYRSEFLLIDMIMRVRSEWDKQMCSEYTNIVHSLLTGTSLHKGILIYSHT